MKMLTDSHAVGLAQRYEELKRLQKEMKYEQERILDELTEISHGQDAMVGGYKLQLVERQGGVKYSDIVKTMLPDLDLAPWRGQATFYWTLR